MTMPLGKLFILIGLALVTAGLLFTLVGKIPYIGRLPGDIHIERGNFNFYFPFATCLLISLLLSLLFWLFRR